MSEIEIRDGELRSIRCKRLFDGTVWQDDVMLRMDGGRIGAMEKAGGDLSGNDLVLPDGWSVVPGFVDLQVNGGGGVLLNNDPTVAGISTICAAHRQYGTTALLPTLITDTPEITAQAIAAGAEAARQGVPGFAGLHLEGPHLSVARKGTHSAELIRAMTADDLEHLAEAAKVLPKLLVTLAPESATPEQVEKLVAAGVTVSLGHSDAELDVISDFVEAGASMVTHLFNAMSPLRHRDPGLVGAALGFGSLSCGLIADGFHVDPLAIQIALDAKRGPGKIFLVTDAMSSLGSDETSFFLNGREVFRRGGRLTLADGTLAGADINMYSCIRFMQNTMGLSFEASIGMATVAPAKACGLDGYGQIAPGSQADLLLLDDKREIRASVIAGMCLSFDSCVMAQGAAE